jgi:hypothetical protein
LFASFAIRRYISVKRIHLCYHYETIHKGNFGHFEGKLREDKFKLLKLDLQQHDVFTAHNKLSEAAVYASFSLLQIIAEQMKRFMDGESVMEYILKATDILLPLKSTF